MSKLVKGTIKIMYFLCLLLTTQFTLAQENELLENPDTLVSYSDETAKDGGYTEKKQFNNSTYNELKKEVELVEEIAKKKLRSDSSEFGRGYGAEYGKDYFIWEFDSVTGEKHVSESRRKSGDNFKDDGVRRNAREPDAYRRDNTKRRENTSARGKIGKPSKRKYEKARRKQLQTKSGRDGTMGSFFLILFLAVVVGAIVYFIFIKTPIQGSSIKISYEKDFDPTKIQRSELEIKIQEAEESQNFRAATRYYFIWAMKELSDRNYITWKKKKTNYHYISEVSKRPFAKDFSRAVNVFEYVWYGKYNIQQSEYNSVKKEFSLLIRTITLQGNK